jgi:hypothetical protein
VASVPAFLGGFATGSFKDIPGLSANILAVGMRAYKVANSDAYSTVFYTTIAFTGVAVIFSFFAPNVDDQMTGKVAVTLHHRTDNETVGMEKVV